MFNRGLFKKRSAVTSVSAGPFCGTHWLQQQCQMQTLVGMRLLHHTLHKMRPIHGAVVSVVLLLIPKRKLVPPYRIGFKSQIKPNGLGHGAINPVGNQGLNFCVWVQTRARIQFCKASVLVFFVQRRAPCRHAHQGVANDLGLNDALGWPFKGQFIGLNALRGALHDALNKRIHSLGREYRNVPYPMVGPYKPRLQCMHIVGFVPCNNRLCQRVNPSVEPCKWGGLGDSHHVFGEVSLLYHCMTVTKKYTCVAKK